VSAVSSSRIKAESDRQTANQDSLHCYTRDRVFDHLQ